MHLRCAMSPTFNGSFALQHLERGNAVELHNGIMLDFHPGLPHLSIYNIDWHTCDNYY